MAAQQSTTSDPGIEAFQGPVVIEQPALEFPDFGLKRGKEGWVELNFMVNAEGKAYEIMVAENIGESEFIDAAVAHLEQTTFAPARLGDEIVDGSARRFYTFVLEGGSDAARESFVNRYQFFARSLEKDSREEIERRLQRLEAADIANMYEHAYLSLARYLFAERFGTPLERMQHLKLALAENRDEENPESYLGESAAGARRLLLQLQIQNGRYAEALETLYIIERSGDQQATRAFSSAFEEIEALRKNDQAYAVRGELDNAGEWEIMLLKDQFWLQNVEGNIAELKLRCQRSFFFYQFDPAASYDISDRAGNCSLQVIGTPGTMFRLMQR